MKNTVCVCFVFCMLAALSLQAALFPVAKQTISLKPGWNLVSLNHPLDESQGNIDSFLELKPFTVDENSHFFVPCVSKESIRPGIGYWIFSKTDKQLELALDVSQSSWDSSFLNNRWNLIGKDNLSTWPDQSNVIWKWQDGKFLMIQPEAITRGNGFWVHAVSAE